ncbi:MAG: hypothetical protein KF830_15810 [Planctomycetes bacterium]|nr:hypothetical protein [Planctomycetota bacterium]
MKTVLHLLVAAPSLLAQTTHLVGPGGLPQIRDALAIAAPGDTILVQPGTYAHFEVGFGVTIQATSPGTVAVAYDPAFAPPGCLSFSTCAIFQGPTQFVIPVGQTATVVGVQFQPATVVTPLPGISVRHRVNVRGGGTVAFDQCTFAADDVHAVIIEQFSKASFVACTVTGGGTTITANGLHATYANVSAVGSTFTGNSASLSAPGHGVYLFNASLHGSNLVVQGGASAFGQSPALRAGSSTVWLADSSLTGGGAACPILSTSSVRLARTTLAPTAGCPPTPTGSVVGTEQPAPPTNGATYTLHLRTEPNQMVFVFASDSLVMSGVPAPGGVFEQPVGLGAPFFADAGIADATGLLSLSWAMPAGQFLGTPLWLQAISGTNFPLQLGPVVGGIVR